jgi:hypothetical protein
LGHGLKINESSSSERFFLKKEKKKDLLPEEMEVPFGSIEIDSDVVINSLKTLKEHFIERDTGRTVILRGVNLGGDCKGLLVCCPSLLLSLLLFFSPLTFSLSLPCQFLSRTEVHNTQPPLQNTKKSRSSEDHFLSQVLTTTFHA